MGKIMHILLRVLVGGDAQTLSNKNELILLERFACKTWLQIQSAAVT